MTNKWRADNTEGFDAEDLEVLNEAQQHLEAANPGIDPGNIADRLNNAWQPDLDARQLQRAVQRQIDG